ncbi:hypothetical protein TNCV_284011 [Trichonephila clavipes]|uniref:Uncharacterized protein n=1 Tax=Trichonephila clavipes TaxID=2585209 RepID=A0A8X6SIY7_TRICX|nr:hypothetical protein TNCV_284011 [Trichonephila clavipes]
MSNTTSNHDTECRTSVPKHNATVQHPLITVSPNSNLTILMLQAEVGYVSKHNVLPLRCPCPPFITPLAAQTSVISSKVQTKQRTSCGHSTLLKMVSNGGYRMDIEWIKWISNNA